MKQPRDPFAIPLSSEQQTTIGQWLGVELDNAIASRSAQENEVEYWHALYEQARTRNPKALPWPDAADLTSHIPCEKVDSIHARLMRTVWVNPVWTVEGWGQAADRAPAVEEFHQWKVEEERLQGVLDKIALNALIEPRGLLEVYESTERRTSRKQITAKPQMTPEGGMLFGADGQAQLATDDQGQFQEADANELGVTTVIDSHDLIRTGPQYRVLPYRDSLILPGHARDKEEIWGYAKRIWPRLSDLKAKAKDGQYDADAVDSLTDLGDRDQSASLRRSLQDIAPQRQETAEKELWECLVLVDLNTVLTSRGQPPLRGQAKSSGSRWYLATIHLKTFTLLRCQYDDFDRSRYVPFILFPRPDRCTEGFSFVGHKLVTASEEHSAYRNMAADRSSLAGNAPILKMTGALWDEDEQPWGPKQVITVRDPREITPLVVPDVPESLFHQIEACERAGDRLSGLNDIAAGQIAKQSRTLGEIQMATTESLGRVDLIIKRFQEAMEDLGQIRHAIWKRTLAENPAGVDAPQSVLIGLEGRGVPIDQYLPDKKITAALLDGPFRFKPNGSVETADLGHLRDDFVGLMQALPMVMQAFPGLGPMFSTDKAARAMGRQFLRVFRVPNQQAFLGSPSEDLQQSQGQPPGPHPATIPPGSPPPPPDPMQLAQLEFSHKQALAQMDATLKQSLAQLQATTADNESRRRAETAIAVAEINKRMDVFLQERERIGVQQGQVLDQHHEAVQASLDRAHEAQQAQQAHDQQLEQIAAQPAPAASGGA